MYVEYLSKLDNVKMRLWQDFLKGYGLTPDVSTDKTVIIWENGKIIATGSRKDDLVKCVAVSEEWQGEGLTSRLITEIRQDAFKDGITHLFLYTKPENEDIFSSLFFYPIAQTKDVLLMESKKNGIKSFFEALPISEASGIIGSVVMNCNPFTLGHQYLIERAAGECDHLYVFAVSEDKSEFSFNDRFEMMRAGTSHIKNISLLPTGPYLISSASFPDYFLKDRDEIEKIHCLLDVELFIRYYAERFSIKRRYVGTEPLSSATACYNDTLKKELYLHGIELIEIPRLTCGDIPISASEARKRLSSRDISSLEQILPTTTIDHLKSKKMI